MEQSASNRYTVTVGAEGATDGYAGRLDFSDERQDRIAGLVAGRGKVRTSRLTELLGVSEPTIRKDLSALERRGLLKRTHGGAVAVRPPLEAEFSAKAVRNAEAKRRIAEACLEEIGEGDAVFLDSGTTCAQVAWVLAASGRRATVLTDAPAVAEILADAPGVTQLLLGGQLRKISGCLTGPLALENLNRFAFDVAFVGASGMTESGVTVSDLGEAQLKAVAVSRARRVILPVDRTKVGVTDFARVCGPEDLDVVITDGADEHLKQLCGTHRVRLVVADFRPEP